MKRLLLLTDFSQGALHALEYTLHLMKQLSWKELLILNVNADSDAFLNMPIIAMGQSDKIAQDKEEMSHLMRIARTQLGSEAHIDALLRPGKLKTVVSEIIEERSIDIAIMGISGKSGLEKYFIGSNTTSMIDYITIPLIVVPVEAKLNYTHTLLIGMDRKKTNLNVASDKCIEALTTLFSTVVYAHITTEENETVPNDTIVITSEDPIKGLLAYAETHPVAMVGVMHRKRSSAANLFHHSVSKNILWESPIPILVLSEA